MHEVMLMHAYVDVGLSIDGCSKRKDNKTIGLMM